MRQNQINEAASLMGKRSYRVRVERFGIERLREIARQNGKKGGRPPKGEKRNAD
jgi:hypothetical protein